MLYLRCEHWLVDFKWYTCHQMGHDAGFKERHILPNPCCNKQPSWYCNKSWERIYTRTRRRFNIYLLYHIKLGSLASPWFLVKPWEFTTLEKPCLPLHLPTCPWKQIKIKNQNFAFVFKIFFFPIFVFEKTIEKALEISFVIAVEPLHLSGCFDWENIEYIISNIQRKLLERQIFKFSINFVDIIFIHCCVIRFYNFISWAVLLW